MPFCFDVHVQAGVFCTRANTGNVSLYCRVFCTVFTNDFIYVKLLRITKYCLDETLHRVFLYKTVTLQFCNRFRLVLDLLFSWGFTKIRGYTSIHGLISICWFLHLGYLRLGCMERDSGQIYGASEWFKDALQVNQVTSRPSYVIDRNTCSSKCYWSKRWHYAARTPVK